MNDSIYCNGKIITMEGKNEKQMIETAPEAILVSGNKIKSVGTFKEVKHLAKEGVEIIDLKGKCLMPSFIDSHSHVVMNGQMSLCVRLSECTSFDDIIQVLKNYIISNSITKEHVVVGFGYDHNFLKEERHPDKIVLDQVSKEIPIFILHISGHLGCINSAALAVAHICQDTPNPAGGVIGRLEDGREPSGYLEEAGIEIVQKAILSKMQYNIFSIIHNMQRNYIENGITTVQDGATTKNDLEILKKAAAYDKLKIDVVAYPLMTANGEELLHSNKDINHQYKNHLKIGGYKLILDGSPQGKSAWMSQPYLGDNNGYCGYPWLTNQQVEQFVINAVKEREQLLVHCNGDAASEQYLNAYENAIEKYKCEENLRPVMIHCQTIRNDQLDRMSRLKMIASIFVGHVWYWGDVHLKNFGLERGNHISPVKDAIDRDVLCTFHQDTPVTQPDMLHSIWCAVNRVSRKNTIIGEDQKTTVYNALKAITINAAYQYFEEYKKGSIKAGKLADLVILDHSPFEIEPMEIKNIKVLKTIKDGNVIFEKKS